MRQRLPWEAISELMDNFTESMFRLEALQEYTVSGDDERRSAWREGRPLPPPRPAKAETIRDFRQLTEAGRRIHRVHVVDLPLTEYVSYELHVYQENVDAGEDVRIAERSAHPDLEDLREDFVLLDGDTDHPVVIWYRYDQDGRLVAHEVDDDPVVAAHCRAQRDLALAHSVPLAEFDAQTAGNR